MSPNQNSAPNSDVQEVQIVEIFGINILYKSKPVLYIGEVIADVDDPANDHEPYWTLFTPDRRQYRGFRPKTQQDLVKIVQSMSDQEKIELCEGAIDYYRAGQRIYALALDENAEGKVYLGRRGAGRNYLTQSSVYLFCPQDLVNLIHDTDFIRVLLAESDYDNISVINILTLQEDAVATDLFKNIFRGLKNFSRRK